MSSPLELVKRLEFFTSNFCPFAHRSFIAIIESQLQGKLPKFVTSLNATDATEEQAGPALFYNEIDLQGLEQTKDYFKKINPQGKLPVLQLTLNNGTTLNINESLVIAEFIQETFNADLLPQYPENVVETNFAKAQYKSWVSYFDSNLNSLFFKLALEQPTVEQLKSEILPVVHDRISFLVQNGFKPNQKGRGDFFFGDKFSLFEAAIIPFIIRWEVVLRNQYGIDLFEPLSDNQTIVESLTIFKKWYQATISRPSVKKSSYEPEFVAHSTTSNATKKAIIAGFEATLEEELSGKEKKEIVSTAELQVDWFNYEKYLIKGFEIFAFLMSQKK